MVRDGSRFDALQKCEQDWDGETVVPPVEFGFLLDSGMLRFRAQREASATCHPESRAGGFQEELWRYDVAEFFLSHPENGSYLEVNLAPNGAWWACLFRAPRERWGKEHGRIAGVEAEGEVSESSWCATLSIPVAALRALPVGFGEGWGLNAAFILSSPNQRFISVGELGPGVPDFHQATKFPPLKIG